MSFLIGVGRKHFRNFSYMVCPKLMLNLKCRLLALSTAALSTLTQQTSVGHWSSCSSESENHLKICRGTSVTDCRVIEADPSRLMVASPQQQRYPTGYLYLAVFLPGQDRVASCRAKR